MIRTLLLLLFLLYRLCACSGQTDSLANQVFVLIYQQDLAAAEQLLNTEKNKLTDFYYLFLNLDLHWWKYRTLDTKADAKALEVLIEQQNQFPAHTDQQKMNRLLVKSYQLRYEKTRLNLPGMIRTRAEIKNLIGEMGENQFPGSIHESELFESYVIMGQYVDEINVFWLQNNSEERHKKLLRMEEFAANENLILNTVARFFLARMYQKVEKDPQTGFLHYKILTAKFPTNRTFAAYQKECEKQL